MGFFRRTAELLSRNRIIRRDIQVSGVKAPIFVSPDAQLKYLKPGKNSFDQDLVRIAELITNEDDFIWDIGANVGVFSVAALVANPKCSVLAIEADPWLADVLVRTSAFARYEDREFLVLPAAVASENGVAEFLIASRGRASNSLAEFGGRSQMGGVRRKQLVPTLNLDSIAERLGPPQFMKIDVEGAEFSVLEGGSELLKSHSPAIYMETSLETFEKAKSSLAPLGYLVFDPSGNEVTEHFANCYFIHQDDDKHLKKIEFL